MLEAEREKPTKRGNLTLKEKIFGRREINLGIGDDFTIPYGGALYVGSDPKKESKRRPTLENARFVKIGGEVVDRKYHSGIAVRLKVNNDGVLSVKNETDANKVVACYRDEEYKPRREEIGEGNELIIDMNRDNPSSSLKIFDGIEVRRTGDEKQGYLIRQVSFGGDESNLEF